MTTSSTARPTTGAGPTPTENRTMPTYRTYERVLDAVDNGRIARDPNTYEYVDNHPRSGSRIRDINDVVLYMTEDRGWLRLHTDGRIDITQAGRQWRTRTRHPGPPAKVEFRSAEAVA